MALASHQNPGSLRIEAPVVGVSDVIEMKESLKISHAPGIVLILDSFPSSDPERYIGRSVSILTPDERSCVAKVEGVRDHGATISFFFRGLTKVDVPIGSRVKIGED